MAGKEDDEYVPVDFDRGDLSYALKRHDPPPPLHGKRCTPAEVKAEVLSSPRLLRVAKEVAAESGRSLQEVQQETASLLEEIGHKMAVPAVRSLALVLRAVFRRVLNTIVVNRSGLEELRRAVREGAVVLLPSHRSYLDFILVTYIMFEHNITLPSIAAGQDFLNMSVVSSFLRRSGGFFLRRTFGSDKLYKTVFSLYVQTLLCNRDAPIEFFIEGTRSRTAKTLHPKLGLLSMVVQPYLDARLPDIALVPISISYQRTLEESLFARELLGVPKPKESTRGLFRARSILCEEYGRIVVHIGRSLSLHDLCVARGISRVPRSLFPRDMAVVLPSDRWLVHVLAHTITEHVHAGMRLHPSSLLAALLLQHTPGLDREELAARLRWLRRRVEERGGVVHGGGASLDDTLRVMLASLEVSSTGSVRCRGPTPSPPGPTPSGGRLAEVLGSELSRAEFDGVMETGFLRLSLAHYRNQLLFLFVPEAMLVLCCHGDEPTNKAVVRSRFQALHSALLCEFVLPLPPPDQLFSKVLLELLDRGLLLLGNEGDISMNYQQQHLCSFLCGLLLPFVEGVWVLCQQLLSLAGGVQTLGEAIKGTQQLAAKCIKGGVLQSYEALSLNMARNSLASLTRAGLILQATSEYEVGRDRLVKVCEPWRLQRLADTLGGVLQVPGPSRSTAKL